MKNTLTLPISVKKALIKLGGDIKLARIKRRITMELMAERAGISRITLTRVERGNATVSIGIFAKVLFVLGMNDRLAHLLDAGTDEVGLLLEQDNLPKRVRYRKDKQ